MKTITTGKNDKQFGGLDYFRFLAALLVVAIHTSPLTSFSANADFVFTRIIARMAVPFFLMVSGFFLLPQYLFGNQKVYNSYKPLHPLFRNIYFPTAAYVKSKDGNPLLHFLKKSLSLYIAAILLYLPVNLYAGHFNNAGILSVFRIFLFDGTFYHLWYLPASILGVLLVIFLGYFLPFRGVAGISSILYFIGLLGDSYFGLIANFPFIETVYDKLFHVFSYTRNGIFYAPIFLVMGAWLGHGHSNRKYIITIPGFFVSLLFMLLEGITLHNLGMQRHDSMYIALLPCMFFLFQLLAAVKSPSAKHLRTISTGIYIIHPLIILLVRGIAKTIHLERILIDNSLIHYIVVCFLSCLISAVLSRIYTGWTHIHNKDWQFYKGRAWIELSQENLYRNVSLLCDLLPPNCQLMPVLKANAYGHGAVLMAKALNNIEIKSFCVASVAEGIELRRGGIKGDILILGYTHPKQFPLLRRYNLIQTVVDEQYAKVLNMYGKKIRVHIKIDTGMHRLGICSEQLGTICDLFLLESLVIEGIYTHLSADDTTALPEKTFTYAQGQALYKVVSKLKDRGYPCPKVHMLASYGLINYPELAGDYARIGIALYGVLSNRTDFENCHLKLRPVLSVRAKIAVVKKICKGDTVGYGLDDAAKQDTKIAVLAIGYADGIPRSLSRGKGKVLIHGYAAEIIGRICMDQTIVDITDIPNVKAGDTAVIIGKSGKREITAYDLAEQAETITNELLSRLGSRLERILV